MIEKIIDIDFSKIGEGLAQATDPKVIVMSDDTLLACLADNPDIFEESETEIGTIFYINNVPISLNSDLDFGYVIVK